MDNIFAGIMTFHQSNNCGSILQAYALQKILRSEYNIKSEIIDFSNFNQKNMYALFRNVQCSKDILINIVTLLLYKKFLVHYEDYEAFKKNHLIVSAKSYSTVSELRKESFSYNILIAGSDQIWNIHCPDADDSYYLCFTDHIKKIAYAPSFGATNLITKALEPKKYKEYLESFSSISIRENNGRKWISQLINKDVPVLLDPTLLLSSEQWNKLITQEVPKERYIFYYAFSYTREVNHFVVSIGKALGLPVYILDMKSWVKSAAYYGIKITPHSGPETFLNYIKHAELVFTTSFHGTVFSAIYEKNFWYINSSMHNEDDDRAYTILSQIKLLDRIIETDQLKLETILTEPDFNACNREIETLREKSLGWLKNAIYT